VTRPLDPTGAGRARRVTRWKPALNAFAITFSDRFPAAENLLTEDAGNTVGETEPRTVVREMNPASGWAAGCSSAGSAVGLVVALSAAAFGLESVDEGVEAGGEPFVAVVDPDVCSEGDEGREAVGRQ